MSAETLCKYHFGKTCRQLRAALKRESKEDLVAFARDDPRFNETAAEMYGNLINNLKKAELVEVLMKDPAAIKVPPELSYSQVDEF